MDLISWGIQTLKDFIATVGYPGIFLLMTLESMAIPIPSEVVMTFGGWLAYDGVLSLFWVGMAGTLGCVAGSAIAYWIGEYGGRPFIKRYGRYLLLSEESIDSAETWFKKYGAIAVFGSRLLPVVRTFISIPAGIAKMNFWSFIVLTFLGSLPWCYALAYAGYLLGANYESIQGNFTLLTILVVVAVAALLVYFIYIRRRRSKHTSNGARP
ncbi:MAG TPA: DedA family protein [Methanomassiliicoccales archaeon]|nr:DedA family protein [Methanomassiliicoccales archaeon]